jgi:hypothetical protein
MKKVWLRIPDSFKEATAAEMSQVPGRKKADCS